MPLMTYFLSLEEGFVVRELSGALAQYTRGKLPSHCGTSVIIRAFSMPAETVEGALTSLGYLKDGKPTRLAVQDGLLDRWRDKVLWSVDNVLGVLKRGVPKVERVLLNQEFPKVEDGCFVNTSTIGTYFDVSSVVVGRWLKEIGVRDPGTGKPSRDAVKSKLVQVAGVETAAGRRETYLWDLRRTLRLLVDAGYVFDYDYGKTMVGRGRNSDVSVCTVEDKAAVVAEGLSGAVAVGDRAAGLRLLRDCPGVLLRLVEERLRYPVGSLSDQGFVDTLF